MTTNRDGTATCDRCGAGLAGFGVVNGLVCTHLVDGQMEELIFCYVNGCREVALDGLDNLTTTPDDARVRCTDDGTVLGSRSVETAMLLTDLATVGARYLQLCYAAGSRDRLLTNVGRLP